MLQNGVLIQGEVAIINSVWKAKSRIPFVKVKLQLTVRAIVRVTLSLEDIYLSAVTLGFTV